MCLSQTDAPSGEHLSRERLPEVLQQPVEHPVRAAPAVELAEQPGAPRGGGPDVLHGDAGGCALELELEERLRAAAVDDLDPAVRGGGDVLDDLDDGVGLASVALEVQPMAVAFAFVGGARDREGAVREPLGHAGGIRNELEHPLYRDADGAVV